MLYSNVNYKIQSLILTNANKVITEGVVANYFRTKGWKVTNKYILGIRSSKYKLSKEGLEVFDKYKDGYPDLILKKGNTIRFIELKLDGDCLRPNQVVFNNELALHEDVTILYVHNEQRYSSPDEVKTRKPNTNKTLIKEDCKRLAGIQRKKNLKPLWVVSQLFSTYGDAILTKNNISTITQNIKVGKDKIVWFVKEVLSKDTAS